MATTSGDGSRQPLEPAAAWPPALDPALVEAVGPPEGERYGPLTLRRYVKGDGRALILFERADADAPPPGPPPP